jgi:hypothetical protein
MCKKQWVVVNTVMGLRVVRTAENQEGPSVCISEFSLLYLFHYYPLKKNWVISYS